MLTEIKRRGNSLGISIPNELANEIGLEIGSEVELRVVNGCLKIYPPGTPHYTLEELVAQITPENRHEEVDWGPPVGKEAW